MRRKKRIGASFSTSILALSPWQAFGDVFVFLVSFLVQVLVSFRSCICALVALDFCCRKKSDARSLRGGGVELSTLKNFNLWLHYFFSK
jgi:hypothetical protein